MKLGLERNRYTTMTGEYERTCTVTWYPILSWIISRAQE